MDTFNDGLIKTIGLRRTSRKMPGVMFVEDDAFFQRLVRTLFTQDFEVTMAHKGEEAVNLYVQQAPDVVFLDIGLPGMGGHQVLEDILRIDADAYVIMLSGQGNRNNVLRAVEYGAKSFIVKPFTPEHIFQQIGNCPTIKKKQKRAGFHGESFK